MMIESEDLKNDIGIIKELNIKEDKSGTAKNNEVLDVFVSIIENREMITLKKNILKEKLKDITAASELRNNSAAHELQHEYGINVEGRSKDDLFLFLNALQMVISIDARFANANQRHQYLEGVERTCYYWMTEKFSTSFASRSLAEHYRVYDLLWRVITESKEVSK